MTSVVNGSMVAAASAPDPSKPPPGGVTTATLGADVYPSPPDERRIDATLLRKVSEISAVRKGVVWYPSPQRP